MVEGLKNWTRSLFKMREMKCQIFAILFAVPKYRSWALSQNSTGISLCNVSSLKKAMYGGQVLGPVLHLLLVEAFQQKTGAKDLSGLNDWVRYHERKPPCQVTQGS